MDTYPTPDSPPTTPPKTSGLAIASLVTSLLCVAPAAIILGHIAMSQIKHSAGRLTGWGLALAGTIMGYVAIVSYVLAIPVMFVGAKAYKQGADRAACIMNQRNAQQAVRAYQNLHGLKAGAALDAGAVFSELGISIPAQCPSGGAYRVSKTIPATGEQVFNCPHNDEPGLQHATDHSNW